MNAIWTLDKIIIQMITWILDIFVFGIKTKLSPTGLTFTIWIPDQFNIQIVTVVFFDVIPCSSPAFLYDQFCCNMNLFIFIFLNILIPLSGGLVFIFPQILSGWRFYVTERNLKRNRYSRNGEWWQSDGIACKCVTWLIVHC